MAQRSNGLWKSEGVLTIKKGYTRKPKVLYPFSCVSSLTYTSNTYIYKSKYVIGIELNNILPVFIGSWTYLYICTMYVFNILIKNFHLLLIVPIKIYSIKLSDIDKM